MALHSCLVGLHVEWDPEIGHCKNHQELQWDLEGLDTHRDQKGSIVAMQRKEEMVANPFGKDD